MDQQELISKFNTWFRLFEPNPASVWNRNDVRAIQSAYCAGYTARVMEESEGPKPLKPVQAPPAHIFFKRNGPRSE
jgi:hypothetical protein